MRRFVKSVWMYHLIADGPVVVFLWFWLEAGTPGNAGFVLFAVLYPFAYRPLIDYYRLLAIDEITESDFPKMWKWGTFYRFKYYGKLMFGR